jgi:hypothetical protein
MEHTPVPWKHRAVSGGWDGVVAETGEEICRLSYNNPSNADFIATACNCHEALVEACKAQKLLIEDMMRFVGQMALKDYQLLNEAPIMAAAALKKAGVEP